MICTCTHLRISHRYLSIIGDNTGKCLAPGCDCVCYEAHE